MADTLEKQELMIINQLLCGLQRDLVKVWSEISRMGEGGNEALKLTCGVLKQLDNALSALQEGNVQAMNHPEEFTEALTYLRSLNRDAKK